MRDSTGAKLEARVARERRDAGARVEVARPDVRWLPPRCRACGRGRTPRSIAHDLFGVADVLDYTAAAWTVTQCGHAGSQAAKRRALDGAGPWPPGTVLRVVTPDGRTGAGRGAVRVWQRTAPSDGWVETGREAEVVESARELLDIQQQLASCSHCNGSQQAEPAAAVNDSADGCNGLVLELEELEELRSVIRHIDSLFMPQERSRRGQVPFICEWRHLGQYTQNLIESLERELSEVRSGLDAKPEEQTDRGRAVLGEHLRKLHEKIDALEYRVTTLELERSVGA